MTANGPFELRGLTALITGAGRGLGASIATELAAAGAKTFILSRSRSELDELAQRIVAQGGQAQALVCDVTDPSAMHAAIDSIPQLDILVNNAGANIPADFVDVTTEQLDSLL